MNEFDFILDYIVMIDLFIFEEKELFEENFYFDIVN